MAAALGFVLLMMVNLLFAVFGGGDGLGFRSGPLGVVFGVVGILLGACFLALDSKQVEDGIAYGAARGGVAGGLRPDDDPGVDLHGVPEDHRDPQQQRLTYAARAAT
ncbi:hypothetical protein SALBM311S_02666 [Streptomyces alboniger]